VREIYGVVIITSGILLLLAFFFKALGPVGVGLEWFFSYLLGKVRYPLPFVVISAGAAVLLGRVGEKGGEDRRAWKLTWVEVVGAFLLVISSCSLFHLGVGDPSVMFLKEELFAGGGLCGACTAWPLTKLMGPAGAYVLVSAVGVVGFLMLTGLTVSHFLHERLERRREERRRAREGRARERKAPRRRKAGEPEAVSRRRRMRQVPERERAEEGAAVAGVLSPGHPASGESSDVLREEADGQMAIEIPEEGGGNYRLPPLELLHRSPRREAVAKKSLNESIAVLERTLDDFGVDAAVTRVTRGPTVTRFELELGSGVKVNRVLSLSDDIAYAMGSPDIRIITPIPGKSAIGIEIPNRERDLVTLGDILSSPRAGKVVSPLRVGLGKDVAGKPVVVDLRESPHLLLAGATGTGKSCCINAMITSILMNSKPLEVRMLLVDPKYVEFTHYDGIPHLLAPVITDPKKAASALGWVVKEMESRYQLLSAAGVKNIVAYHGALREGLEKEKDERGNPAFPRLPYIVVFIDELADLMMVAPAEVEDSIARIAQMARAVGIHLVVATQRPSVDVVTGLIKANMPSRIAFTVASQADSRVVLDIGGAEKLVGHGDMLFLPAGASRPVRVQGAYVSEKEILAVVGYIKRQAKAEYEKEILEEVHAENRDKVKEDDLVEEAMRVVVKSGTASASLLQRKLRVGYARAARLIDILEDLGVVGGYEGSKPRAVLMTPEEWEERERRKDRERSAG
jgi:S-DNA-T family DNA segregation ATPase FtsK/SpoIIIE